SPALRGPFYTIISDGRTISDNLKSIGRDNVWLNKVISEKGARSTAEVYFLCADAYGNIIFCKEDHDQ
ncbi:MAG: hypothetical protein IIW34_04465, partial [Clostridia bacterium]|nr:hypothetical protein [Clostridia bacterium]